MLPGIAIDAEWLAALSEADVESLEILRTLDLAGVPLLFDVEGRILEEFGRVLPPDRPGRRFFGARLNTELIRFVSAEKLPAVAEALERRPHLARLAPYLHVGASGAGAILSTVASDDATALGELGITVVAPSAVGQLVALPRTTQAEKRALVLTALPVERAAVVAHLRDVHQVTHVKGTIYTVGTFGAASTWEVAVAEAGPHNARTALEAERALASFSPDVALFVGVAGGIKDVTVGDVVAVTVVNTYDTGKLMYDEENGVELTLPRPLVAQSNYRLIQRARAEAASTEWVGRILGVAPAERPTAYVGPIVAGGWVIATTKAILVERIRSEHSDALALEMEGHGFLDAAYSNDTPAIVIRGISDMLADKALADASGSQAAAAAHAAAFAFELLDKHGRGSS